MNKFEPKQGERVLVADRLDNVFVERAFVVSHNQKHYCSSHATGGLRGWIYMKTLPPEPSPIPFTHETWPKQVVWLRFAGNGGLSHGVQVIDFFAEGVCMKNTYPTFKGLTNSGWQMSLDFCQTWQPCHYAPESS